MKKNTYSVTEQEAARIEIIKNTFSGEDTKLKVIRKMILGVEMDKDEKAIAKELGGNPHIVEIIETAVLPKLTGDEEIYEIKDIWFQLNVRNVPKDDAIILMKSVAKNIEFMEDALDSIKNGTKRLITIEQVAYSPTNDDVENLVALTARNTIIAGVEGMLRGIRNIAGEKGETMEELMKRLAKNSTK